MSSKTSESVPGLKPSSVEFGNLGDISKAGSLHAFLLGLHKKFGSIASFWWGPTYTVSISSADLFEEQWDIIDRPPELFEAYKPLFEAKSIQFANKEEGCKRRQHYTKALSDEAILGYIPQFQEVADEMVGLWNGLLDEPGISLSQYTSIFALKSLLHTLFGNLMKDEKEETDFRRETDEVWDEMEHSIVEPLTKAEKKHLQEETKDLKELIQKMLKDRKSDPPKTGEETLLDLIMNYSDDEEQQLAECLEFTTAGLHGMEFLLAFALYFVATNPEVDKKVYEEIQTVLSEKDLNGASFAELRYLRQVLDETLRCSVLVPWAARFQDVDSVLGGFKISKNTPVIHALGVAMKDAKIWPQPDKFDPERFSDENQHTRSGLWFSPFGVGKRECLARQFPYVAVTVAMVTLLKKFKIQVVGENQRLSSPYGIVTHQKEDILVKLSERQT